jgi:hypothetical protein
MVLEPIDWIWDGSIALAKFHVLGGKPDAGKTTVSLTVAAVVSPIGWHSLPGFELFLGVKR